MNKLKNIEFLRTYLITAIVMLHVFVSSAWSFSKVFPQSDIYQVLHDCFAASNNCVEGFFIIAGFLLFYTFKPKTSLKEFIIKKYIRLSPVILFATLLCILGWALGVMHFKLIPNILTILLLNHFGICWAVGCMAVLWYVSAMFSALLLYFSILKYISHKYQKYLIVCLAMLGYIILEYLQKGRFSDPYHNYYYIFNIGFLRAIGGTGLGCLIGLGLDKFKTCDTKIILNKIMVITITFFEFLFMAFMFWWTLCPHAKINNIVFVVIFAILFILFILQKGYITKFFNKDIWVSLGKYSYSIYVIHYPVGKILVKSIWRHHSQFVYSYPFVPIILTLAAILAVGVFAYYMVELPCAGFLKDRLIRKDGHTEQIQTES